MESTVQEMMAVVSVTSVDLDSNVRGGAGPEEEKDTGKEKRRKKYGKKEKQEKQRREREKLRRRCVCEAGLTLYCDISCVTV